MTNAPRCGRILEQKKKNAPFSPCRFIEYGMIFTLIFGVISPEIGVCRAESLASHDFFCRESGQSYGGVFSISAKEMIINEEIRFPEVRVVGVDGEAVGIMSSDAALKMAYDKGYDLVLMAAQAQPPVCRIMDYGKYRFERDKKEKEAKKKQQTVELKEIQLSCRIDTHDFETKLRHAQRFLESGNKVRVVMRFRGREMSHIAIGQELMNKFKDECSELGGVDKAPVLDGRILSMVISPLKLK